MELIPRQGRLPVIKGEVLKTYTWLSERNIFVFLPKGLKESVCLTSVDVSYCGLDDSSATILQSYLSENTVIEVFKASVSRLSCFTLMNNCSATTSIWYQQLQLAKGWKIASH